MAVSELIKNVMNELETLMQTKTVVGDPISAGDYTVIPVSKVSFGFGAGGGSGSKDTKSKVKNLRKVNKKESDKRRLGGVLLVCITSNEVWKFLHRIWRS